MELDEGPGMRSFYATVVDINYVPMALNLYRSFTPFLDDKTFGFFCIDEAAADHLERLALSNAWVLRPADFETTALRAVRAGRATNEYCWTLKAITLQTGFALDPTFDWGIYLDSDMMAFADPDGALSVNDFVVLSPHRFSTAEFAAYGPSVGQFNGGYAAFRNAAEGKAALAWWHERCLESCPAVPTPDAYADQKYLDAMPGRFPGVRQSRHKGLNLAPWNLQSDPLSERDGQVFVGDDPLLLYHFQGLRILGTRLYDLYTGPMRIPDAASRLIYRPYIRSLRMTFDVLRQQIPSFRASIPALTTRKAMNQLRRFLRGHCNLAYT